MNTDFEQALARSGEGLELAAPAEAIIARGDRLRRRRRRTVGAGAAGLLGLAGVFASTVLPADSGLTAPAVAAWSGPTTNLTPEQLKDVTDTCIDAFRDGSWGDMAGDTTPVAAEIRNGIVLAYFHAGDKMGTCEVTQGADGDFHPAGLSEGAFPTLKAGKHFAMLSVSSADEGFIGGQISDIAGFLRVSADVDRVELEIGGDAVNATVSDGVAFFWPEGEYTDAELEDTEVKAFDAEGGLLDEGDLFGEQRVVTVSGNDDAHL